MARVSRAERKPGAILGKNPERDKWDDNLPAKRDLRLRPRKERVQGRPAATLRTWRGRKALRLSNGLVGITLLPGGGHIAEFGFLHATGKPDVNVLWEPHWETAAPGSARARKLSPEYGANGVGQFLASFTGHALCLDYFGAASEDEIRSGLPLHGEAACRNWRIVSRSEESGACKAVLQVKLPAAGLDLAREITLYKNESVAWIREDVRNCKKQDHYFHWVQHVTFGSPFLDAECSRVFLSGRRAKTWPLGYENKSLVASDREFTWPWAPREKGGKVDLAIPFQAKRKGFVASVLLDSSREIQFVAALNWKLGLVAGYIFSAKDFPWVAVWEENCARAYAPWNGNTQSFGMEFGTTPMPIGKEATFLSGKLFGSRCWTKLGSGAARSARYMAFLAEVPKGWREIRDIQMENGKLVITGDVRNAVVRVNASKRGEPGKQRSTE